MFTFSGYFFVAFSCIKSFSFFFCSIIGNFLKAVPYVCNTLFHHFPSPIDKRTSSRLASATRSSSKVIFLKLNFQERNPCRSNTIWPFAILI